MTLVVTNGQLHSGPSATLSAETLGLLMPMYLWLSRDHVIRAMGPTLEKIIDRAMPGERAVGRAFDRVFRLACPGWREGDVIRPARRVHLSLRDAPGISLRGPVTWCDPSGEGGLILNLSFGIHLTGAIREFGLTEADFASSDLAMELLYLQEAKTVVLDELRGLTGRLEEARRSAEDQARTDPLTGLSNRRAFDQALERAVSDRRRRGSPFAIAQLDLDHFKAVNDTLGHAAGDLVLTRVAEILRAETREGDVVCRLGGDEFVLLLRDMPQHRALQALGERIIALLEVPIPFEDSACRISGSIGIAISSDYDVPEVEQMMADADAALYLSKRRGRARCSIARPGQSTEAGAP